VKIDRKIVGLVWMVGVAAVWELGAFLLSGVLHDPMASAKLPYLHDIAVTLARNGGPLLEAAGVTLSKAATGFALGALVGYLLAILMSISRTAERIAFPYLIMSQMIPVLGLAPIIFNLVRDMNTSRIVIAAYIAFFPVAASTLSGFKSVDVEKRQLMHSYAARRRVLYLKLMMPFSLPYLFTGLKIAAPLSVTASILVDMLGSKSGIGVKLLYSLYGGARDIFWASVVTSAVMGVVSYLIVVVAERILVPWQNDSTVSAGAAT
jgi:ABC-type nitrate/sulfonate/bicarbonate transport system permease component